MPVFFHLPARHRPDARRQKAWEDGAPVDVEAAGKTATAQAWIYQTWFRLDAAGADVALVDDLPREGAAVTLCGWLDPSFIAPRGLFVAGVVADGLAHPGVDLQIVQNRWHSRRLPCAVFMRHWPQPGLVPRDSARGAKLETVCFFGDPANLDAELRTPEWQRKFFATTGARFELRGAERWHDYRDVDAVVAVRGFGAGLQPQKPATKLYNAWLAGVPFVAGRDSAYRAEGKPDHDYLVAASAEDVIVQVQKLRDAPAWRQKIVACGWKRAADLEPARLTASWQEMLDSMEEQRRRKLRKTKTRLAWEYRLKAAWYKTDSLRRRE